MNIIDEIKIKLKDTLQGLGVDIALNDIIIEKSKDLAHGDYATNIAMKSCRLFSKKPIEVANLIVSSFKMDEVDHIEIAGPGFINFFMKKDALASIIKRIVSEGDDYGKGEDKHFKVNVEFVSANPTGDLHIGHARGAAIGDSICRILSFAGYDVTREYYINDAGNQIDHLAESLIERYKECLGLPFKLPEDGYHGEDVANIARQIKDEFGDDLLSRSDYFEFFKNEGKRRELDKIKLDLDSFGVNFDIFSSELAVRGNGSINKELDYLHKYTYVQDGATFLKTTDFLDDKDRVIVKSNGDYTYFMPDIVYHVNKISRGFDLLIDVLGADHHGYINRMKSALMMHGYTKDALEVELIQMVRFIKDGEEMKASKRTGNAYTIRELIEEVGKDASRYFFAMRAASSHLDFNMDLAIEQSSNNPVYYAQYAHARLCSILDSASDIGIDINGTNLKENSEMSLLKHLAAFPELVNNAALERAPYRITNYIHELAEKIHSFYTECRVINHDQLEVSKSRLALCKAAKQVMKNALFLVGVSAPTHM